MHHHSPKPALLTAGLALAMMASAAVAATASTAAVAALPKAPPAPVFTSADGVTTASLPGEIVEVDSLDGQGGLPSAPPALNLGGRTYVLPATASHARPAQVRAKSAMYTLTVEGTNLSGKPDTGDAVTVWDADNIKRLPPPGNRQLFDNGVAKFSVPAGHFWLVGIFVRRSGTQPLGTYVDLPPEITVTKNTTVRLDARAATSRIQFATARPTTVFDTVFELDLLNPAAPSGCCAVSFDLFAQSRAGAPATPIYVSPMTTPPGTGKLFQVTTALLSSPSTARGIPYQYNLGYRSPAGTIQPQHFVVNQARLATENSRFYSADTSHGYLANFPAFPIERELGSFAVLPAETFPMPLTMYMTANPALAWNTEYIQTAPNFNFSGGQSSHPQVFLPGQRLSVNWGAYPLHPASGVLLQHISDELPVGASATRTGDTLNLGMDVFSDNTPGHVGWGVNPPFRANGSYQIDQNGAKVASGNLSHYGGFGAMATLAPARSLIKVTMTDTEPAKLNPLSTTNKTVWTWWSAHESGSTLPSGWACATPRFSRSCAVQPLLTLRYGVLGEDLSGATNPGQQVVRLSVGHLQLAQAAKITGVAVSVSFDGGKTWQQATITGAGNSYAAVFNAPAGALVTMRTVATDAAGGSISQTITNAYQVATGG